MNLAILNLLVLIVAGTSVVAAFSFLALFAYAKVRRRETSKKYGTYFLISGATLIVAVVTWGVVGYQQACLAGCKPEVISYWSCSSVARKYIDENNLQSLKLTSCRSKEISMTGGGTAQLVEIYGDCIMGGDICGSLKSYFSLYVNGRFYDIPYAGNAPFIPGSHSICNEDAGGGAFRYDEEPAGLHREIEITASGTMRYRYIFTGYDGGYGFLGGGEGGYTCARTGVMTADLDGKNVKIEKPFLFKVTREPMYCAKPQSYEIERCCNAQRYALSDDPTAPTYSYCH